MDVADVVYATWTGRMTAAVAVLSEGFRLRREACLSAGEVASAGEYEALYGRAQRAWRYLLHRSGR